jgi:hypothetical protein
MSLLNCFGWPLEQLLLYFGMPHLNCFGWPPEQLFLHFDMPLLICFGWPLEQLFWFPGGSLKDSRLSHQFCEVKSFIRKLIFFFFQLLLFATANIFENRRKDTVKYKFHNQVIFCTVTLPIFCV